VSCSDPERALLVHSCLIGRFAKRSLPLWENPLIESAKCKPSLGHLCNKRKACAFYGLWPSQGEGLKASEWFKIFSLSLRQRALPPLASFLRPPSLSQNVKSQLGALGVARHGKIRLRREGLAQSTQSPRSNSEV